MNYNRVIIAGNITRDPEMRYLPKGTAIVQLSVAINRERKTETGEKKEEVSFIDVEAFGRQAEVIGQYLRKGSIIHVEGRLKQDTWEDKTTHQKRSKIKVVLESFQFVGRPKQNDTPKEASNEPEPSPQSNAPEEDDVPF